jgi:hypothetical protein
MRSELLVAHEKPGQFLLLTVYVVSVREIHFISTFETAPFFMYAPVLLSQEMRNVKC